MSFGSTDGHDFGGFADPGPGPSGGGDGSPPLGGGEYASFGDWADAVSTGYGVPGSGYGSAPQQANPYANFRGSEPMMFEPRSNGFLSSVGTFAANLFGSPFGLSFTQGRNYETGTPGMQTSFSPLGLGLGMIGASVGMPTMGSVGKHIGPQYTMAKGYDPQEVRQGLMGPEPTLLADNAPRQSGFMDYTSAPRAGGLY